MNINKYQKISTSIYIFLLISNLLFGLFGAPQKAKAGIILKLPSSLGLSTNLVGYWTMDGSTIYGTQLYDQSGNYATGTITGATPAIGKLGQTLKFNGSSDYVDTNLTLSNNQSFTYSAWIYLNSLPGAGTMYWIIGDNNLDGAPNYKGSLLGYSGDNGLQGSISNAAGSAVNIYYTTGAGVLKNWRHVVLVYNYSSGSLLLYYDGVSVNDYSPVSSATYRANDVGGAWEIGRWYGNNYYLNGKIDDVRVYNRALSADEVKRLYNMGASTKINKSLTNSLTSGLVGYWTFDGADISGAAALDKSPVGTNIGTITGAAKTIGKLGQGLSFNGTSDYISVANESNFDFDKSNPFTISGWIYRKSSNTFDNIFSKFDGTTNYRGYGLYFNNSGSNYLYGTVNYGPTNDGIYVYTTSAISNNRWTHVTMTYDGSVQASGVKLYFDGVLQPMFTDENDLVGASILNNTNPSIGLDVVGSSNYFDGSLDDVRVYSRALSASEIQRLYNMGR